MIVDEYLEKMGDVDDSIVAELHNSMVLQTTFAQRALSRFISTQFKWPTGRN